MGILCTLLLLGALAAAAWTLTGESGKAIRQGDRKAKKHYGGKDNDGKNQGF